jgi:hypothetical protein
LDVGGDAPWREGAASDGPTVGVRGRLDISPDESSTDITPRLARPRLKDCSPFEVEVGILPLDVAGIGEARGPAVGAVATGSGGAPAPGVAAPY